MITASGLGSGLDISGMVSQLVAAERAGSDLQLDRANAKYNSKFSALGSLKGALSSFQSSLVNLNTLGNFSKNSESSSVSAEVGISANSSAIASNYAIEVSQLAEAHALASTGVADSDTTTLGTGTLTIRFGTTDYNSGTDSYNSFSLNPDSSVATIAIDSTNNTLEGVMSAINDADVGVSAAIVNDGSGFRLLISSDNTGLENSLEISVADDDANNIDASGLSRFAFNASATNMDQTASALDAQFTLNGLSISSASNTVTEAIPDVSLELKKLTASAVSLSVDVDLSSVISGVNSFVAGYNQFITTANSLSAYDVENDVPSALSGDFTLRSINGQVDNILRNSVSGLTGDIRNLSQIGITTSSSGTLELDAAQFGIALAASPEVVSQLFSAVGTPSDGNVEFSGSIDATQVGSYAVNVTSLASSGVYESAAVLPDFGGGATLTIDSNNDSLTVEVDGLSAGAIVLTAGVYSTGVDLANEIQAQLNGTTVLRDANKTVSVAYLSGSNSFSITSDSVGSSSKVNILSVDTNTAAELGFSVAAGADGADIIGTIDGVAATGVGSVMTAAAGTDAEGLSLIVASGSLGARGEVNFTRGLANQLDMLLGQFLDAEGSLEDRIGSFKDRIAEVSDRRAELELRWEAVQERYTQRFNSLDILLGSLQSTSSYMEDQFKNFVKPNTGG